LKIAFTIFFVFIVSSSQSLAKTYHCETDDGSMAYQDAPCEHQTISIEESTKNTSLFGAKACLYESNLRNQIQGGGNIVKNCIERITDDNLDFLKTCRDIRDLSKKKYADTTMSILDSCPPGAVAVCEKDLYETVDRHFYGYGSHYLKKRASICKKWDGTWVVK